MVRPSNRSIFVGIYMLLEDIFGLTIGVPQETCKNIE